RRVRAALSGDVLFQSSEPAGSWGDRGDHPRARRRRGRQALARRRPHAEQAEHVQRLHRVRRLSRRAAIHRARPARDRGRQRGWPADRRRAQPTAGSRRGRRSARALRRRHQHDARRGAAAYRRRVRGVGQSQGPHLLPIYEELRPLCEPGRPALFRAAGAHVAERQPGDVLGACQVRRAAARALAPDAGSVQDQHGRGPWRRVGPVRLPARDRLRLHLDPRTSREGRMKVERIEHRHADAGKGALDFLKITTDGGIVGWSEYNETFGGVGVSAAIDALAPLVIGRDPRAREAIVTTLYAVRRQAPGGVIQQAIAAIENALLDVQARALGIPVYELLGGPQRQRLRLYWPPCGYSRLSPSQQMQIPPLRNLHDVVAQGKEVVARGYTALKTNIFVFDRGAPHPHMPGFARADSEIPSLNA